MQRGQGLRRRDLIKAGVFTAFGGGLAFSSSASAQTARPAGQKLRVVTTFTIIQDMAQNVAGTAATVESVTKPGAEIHDYQPTPLDVVKAQSADLVLWNGMNLERWFEKFFANVRQVPSAVMSEGIMPIPIRDGAYQGKPNPHAWMSVSAALIYVENIRKALATADPANADIYAQNAAAYADKIKAIAEPLRKRLAGIPEEKRWLVTTEGAFSYLARDLGMREAYLWPINAEEQGTPQQVREVIRTVRRHAIPVVFSESTVSDKPMRQVARETGAAYGGVLYIDSLSDAAGPVPTYLKLLETTVETIARGFGQ
jgi:manganese/iron transport system substrate-binding protein